MILIAESGSTKTNWALLNNNQLEFLESTMGINPYYQSENEIYNEIKSSLSSKIKNKISELYFYGAGCNFENKKLILRKSINKALNVESIFIESDMLAACRGLSSKNKGIVAILGTGANSCYYDGVEIKQNISPLGFILGDEGSGAYIGKRFIADYLKGLLPVDLNNKFKQECNYSDSEIMNRIYKHTMPNKFVAKFSRFINKNIEHDYCYKLVYDSFCNFFERNIMLYKNVLELPIYFTGSVAYFYKLILMEVAKKYNVIIDDIMKSPIQGLIDYHKK